jgi:uncharacterized membrane protein
MMVSLRRCALLPALAVLVFPTMASADFRLCNNTSSRVGVAVGYRDKEGWLTEGWWNVGPKSCEAILRGPLAARYYYVYAYDYDQLGEWSGKSFMCTRAKEFTIRGFEDCLVRGYDRTGFFEIDTGEQKDWTVALSEQAQTGARPRSNAPEDVSRPPPGSPGAQPQQSTEPPVQPSGGPATPAPSPAPANPSSPAPPKQ